MISRPPSQTARWAMSASMLLAGGLLVGMAAAMWWQPILADEWDFYRAAAHWQQNHSLIPHPQAYVHLTQLSLLIFGQSVGSARLVGVLSALISLALIPPIARAFFGQSEQSHWIAVAAVWLYTLNPMTAQNMMLLDIDNTLLVPVLLGVLWVWKAGQEWPFYLRATALGLAFAASLWVKLPTPIVLMGCIGLFHLLRGKVKRVGEWALATLVGGVMFLATFGVYGRLTGFGFALFNPTFSKAPTSLSSIPAMLLRFPQGMGVFIMWLSLPLAALLLIAIAGTTLRLAKRQGEDRDLLTIYVVATTLFYALVITPAWGYPKYQAPLVPVIALLAAALFVPAFQALPRQLRIVGGCLGVVTFAYNLAVIGDPLWSLYAVTFETDVGDLARRLSQGISEAARLTIPAAIVLVLVYLASLRWKVGWLPTLTFTLGALSLIYMASMAAIQVPADYSTRYRYTYDYADLRQTVADLQSVGGYVIAEKSIFWDAGLPGEEIHGYLCAGCPPQALVDRIYSMHVSALAWTTKEANRAPDVLSAPVIVRTLETCYTRLTHGIFTIYLRRADNPCP